MDNPRKRVCGETCAVYGCSNVRHKTPDVSYHKFPKDENLLKTWIVRCRRDGLWNPAGSYICSNHFTSDDFERDLKSELMGTKKQNRLKKGVIPSLNLHKDPSKPSTSSGIQRTEKMEAKNRREEQERMVQGLLAMQESASQDPVSDICEPSVPETNPDHEKVILMAENERLKEKIKELEAKVAFLEKAFIDVANEKLKHVFSPNQLQLAIGEKKKIRWTDDDISKSFTLRCMSKQAYVFIREKLNYPLPGLSSLQRWASIFEIKRGVLKRMIQLMEIWGQNFDSLQKLTVLSFDEMKVEEKIEYSQTDKQFIGPYSQVLTVMARGLCGKWKQPIFIDFDVQLQAEMLIYLITSLKAVGFPVIAVVCDCAPVNRKLRNSLGVTVDNPSFLVEDLKVFFFHDAPHLFRLVRNWLLDTGFILHDGQIVSKEPLKSLVTLTSAEINMCHEISNEHLECTGSQRQRMKLATQLLSHKVSKALEFCSSKLTCSKELATSTAHFISLTNKWFQIMNSRHLKKQSSTLMPYGIHLEEQNVVLDDMYNMINTMRCVGKTSLQVFQVAILTSINSTKQLLPYVKSKFSVDFLLTSRLNQDVLENLHSQIRTRGGLDDHPTPINCLARFRMIVLGKSPGNLALSTFKGSDLSNDDDFIAASSIKCTEIEPVFQDDQTDVAEFLQDIPKPKSAVVEAGATYTEGLEWLTGFIAKKYLTKYPALGSYTYQIVSNEHGYTIPSWIEHVSHGGLTKASPQFEAAIKQIEAQFMAYFPTELPKEKDVVCKVTKMLEAGLEGIFFPSEVLESFVKQRLFIRMKFINQKNSLKKAQKVKFQRQNRLRKTII